MFLRPANQLRGTIRPHKLHVTLLQSGIDLHGMEMYEVGGNLLVYEAGDLNKSPLLPEPGDATSLDQKSNLIIDGVAPDDFTVDEISTFDANNDQQKSGYYSNIHQRQLLNLSHHPNYLLQESL